MSEQRDDYDALQAMAANRDEATTEEEEPQIDPDLYYPTIQEQTVEPPADEEKDKG